MSLAYPNPRGPLSAESKKNISAGMLGISPWTPKREALLRQLWSEGLTSSECVRELGGGVTRSAVCAKIARLGLKGRQQEISLRAKNYKSPHFSLSMRLRGAKGRKVKISVASALPTVTPKPRKLPASLPPSPAEQFEFDPSLPVDLPEENLVGIPFMRANETSCRWPLGDSTNLSDFRFCGEHIVFGSYCSHHAGIAYVPLPQRRISDAELQRRREWGRKMATKRMAR